MNISTDKNSQNTPTSTTYPSSGEMAVGIIKLYQSRCFYITGDDIISAANDRRIEDLSTKTHTPDIIIVAVGFNDYGSGKNIANFEKSYKLMLDKLTTRYPKAEIICGTLAESFVSERSTYLFPLTPGNNKLADFNNVIRKVCKSKDIRVADIAGKENYETLDGVHPTVTGHNTLANLWIDCLKSKI